MVPSGWFELIEGAQTYRRKALDLHLPKALIWASDMPLEAAQDAPQDAAPMRKLWDLYPNTSRSQKRRESAKAWVKIRAMREGSGQQKSGPGEVPLKFKYASNRLTGQTGWAW